ncbi:hypothetical protein [Clostridium sp. B9]
MVERIGTVALVVLQSINSCYIVDQIKKVELMKLNFMMIKVIICK